MNRKAAGYQKDKTLFTPGPLTTSLSVKQAMLRDLGSRDSEFIKVVHDIRKALLALAGVSQNSGYEAILMQGSGTFGIESVISSTVPPDGKLLIIINGAYGERISKMASVLDFKTLELRFPENKKPDLDKIRKSLETDSCITDVALVHCETTTGIFNPVRSIGQIVKEAGKNFIIDAMSSFGAVPVNMYKDHIDFLISSANKCIEGVPGFALILAQRTALLKTEGYARSLSLDLLSQWQGLESNGQFRFTPPTHALLAFHQALHELEAEGGVEGRAKRYQANYQCLVRGMREIGFKEYLRPEDQGYIITSFLYPDDPNFDFTQFYERLNDSNYVIYPGKVSQANCFRIGSIGRICESDIHDLLSAIQQTVNEMGIKF